MQLREHSEAAAIARLVAQIDSIDAWRDRVGRRIVALFLCTFVFALGLLAWMLKSARDNPSPQMDHPGPQVHGVLRGMR